MTPTARSAALVALCLTTTASPAVMAASAGSMVLLRDDSAATWGPAPASLPKGLQFSVLSGNPDQPGPFTLRIKLPANFVIPPHAHATSENLTVLSGAIVHDMGEKMERSHGRALDTGGFVFLPGNTPHSLWTDATPAEIR